MKRLVALENLTSSFLGFKDPESDDTVIFWSSGVPISTFLVLVKICEDVDEADETGHLKDRAAGFEDETDVLKSSRT